MSMISRQIDELRVVEELLHDTNHHVSAQKVNDAIDTIQALSAKVADQNLNRSETPNSSDLISRQAAIDAAIENDGDLDAQTNAIDKLPSADRPPKVVAQITFDEEKLREIVKGAVERFKEEYEITNRPTGKWDKNGNCTNCGEHAPYWAMATTYYRSNYCPNCGAEMKGENK